MELKPLSKDAVRYLEYLNFKMECLAEQEELRWKLDVPKAKKLKEDLESVVKEKTAALIKVMPKKPVYKSINRPKNMYKKDGSLSSHGQNFVALVKEHSQHEDVNNFNIITSWEEGNPGAPQQVKDWLFSLGWEPCTYDYKRGPSGDTRQIPQVRKEGELTDSVLRLVEREPSVGVLEGLTVATHRLSVVKGFLESVEGGCYMVASSHGLTNTLRFKHSKPLVNLPGVGKQYGEDIRSCLIAPEGYLLCGSDMDSLENNTKLHYIWDYDPDYVRDQQVQGFDPHLDLAKFAGVVTQEQIKEHTSGDNKGCLGSLRKAYKVTNYSATYGIQPLGLSRRGGFSIKEATTLLNAFWERNWSLEQIAKRTKTKRLRDGSLWLLNPVSKFWYSLRNQKDVFSTLNQGTGVYCFDTWLKYCRESGLKAIGQFHDEVIFLVKEGSEEVTTEIIGESMDSANRELNLNINISTSPEFGKNYAEVH